ncbi:GFA family protein [Roseateles violae]|uniref:GFA family protein n=1 Tax=Roseateles violae TaxID=3058042 RepID=A0ABT8DW81_9BURK|nr:GFA family protein [Pelomonas sp. PFR6]MDN3922356.1 GFA family protein [Pelomonas sp. PFR6]
MRVTGSCHCGAIAYEAEVDPARVVLCHCSDCQRLSGCAYRVSIATTRQRLRLLRGEPACYVKQADSGARRAQEFCAACGSPLFTYDLATPDRMGLRVGCIDQRQALRPARQIWCRSALPWAMDIAALPRSAEE